MVSYSTVAFADSLTDKQNELKGINENIENTKGEIEKVKGEQSELVNQIAEIEVDLKRNKNN